MADKEASRGSWWKLSAFDFVPHQTGSPHASKLACHLLPCGTTTVQSRYSTWLLTARHLCLLCSLVHSFSPKKLPAAAFLTPMGKHSSGCVKTILDNLVLSGWMNGLSSFSYSKTCFPSRPASKDPNWFAISNSRVATWIPSRLWTQDSLIRTVCPL